ncbi:MAG: twin-arginine translocation signal domain-containing protein [Candidatus Nanohaloarchaea archaeon]
MVDVSKWRDYAEGNRDMTRRDFLKAGGAAVGVTAVGVDAVDDNDNMYTRIVNAIPSIHVDVSVSVGDNGGSNDGSHEGTTTSSPDQTSFKSWVDTYGVNEFASDLSDQGDAAVAATEDFFETAYLDAGRSVDTASISGEMFQLNDISTNMYSTEPGLGYSHDLGSKLDRVDNEGSLENLVEGYINQKMDF